MWYEWSTPDGQAVQYDGRRRRLTLLRGKMNRLYSEDRWAPARMVLVSLVLVVLSTVVLVPTALLTAYVYFANDVPPASIVERRAMFQSTLFYDRKGELLYELFDPNGGRRTRIHIEEIPAQMIQATLAAEDPGFYDNPGVDPLAMARAVVQNYQRGGVVSGASTLTQQLAKNLLFTPEERRRQSVERKIKEAIFAIRLTEEYPKDEILEMYLNETFYGNLSYGIAAAARSYFGKEVKDLTLPEAALLAGLPQSPTDYNPILHFDLAKSRQAYVLDRMVREGYITQQEADDAKAAPLQFADQRFPIRAPHFVDYVKSLIERRYGRDALYSSGWRIRTTVDLNLQKIAENVARQRIAEIQTQMNAHNAAVVAIEPSTGEILTMLGSIDYWDDSIQGKVNVATSRRMPGSSVKPFNYVTAFDLGYVPNSRVDDVRTCFEVSPVLPVYCPQNFEFKINGPTRLRQALSSSLNIPAVKVLRQVGPGAMAETAHKFGITDFREPYRFGLTLTLGTSEVAPLDLTYAYTVFANNGGMVGAPVPLEERELGMREYEPAAILSITDADGREIYRYTPPPPKQVFSPQAAWLITATLSDDRNRHLAYAPNGDLVIDRPSAAKTGTTQFLQDTWTVGYTPDLVAGVWVGNTDGEEMRQASGVISAGRIWHNFMIEAHKYLQAPPRDFVAPPGVTYGEVCGEPGWYINGKAPICYVP